MLDSQKIFYYNISMIASKKQSIEDLIIEVLAKNPYIEGPNLVTLINEVRPKTTKQAVYFALKSLLESETVAKVGSKYFLSRAWLFKISQLFESKNHLMSDAIFNLKDKESISYYFPSLLTCDTYWVHIFSLLIEWTPNYRPIFIWNPHEWFVVGRKNEETNIFNEYRDKNKFVYYLIQGNSPLDKEFRDTWSSDNVSIAIGSKLSFANNYYFNVFDEYIIEVFINQKLAVEIEQFYSANTELTPDNIHTFETLITKKYPVRMRISRKKEKAELLRKKMAKPFFIPKNLSLV